MQSEIIRSKDEIADEMSKSQSFEYDQDNIQCLITCLDIEN